MFTTQYLDCPEDNEWNKYFTKLENEEPKKARIIELMNPWLKWDFQKTQELAELIQEVNDELWFTKYAVFRGKVQDFKKVELTIRSYGKSPKKYGKGSYKFGREGALLLLKVGWELLGKGNVYWYLKPPEGERSPDPKITLLVPEQHEIEKFIDWFTVSNKNLSASVVYCIRWYCWDFEYNHDGESVNTILEFPIISKDSPRDESMKPKAVDLTSYQNKSISLSTDSYNIRVKWDSDGNKEIVENINPRYW